MWSTQDSKLTQFTVIIVLNCTALKGVVKQLFIISEKFWDVVAGLFHRKSICHARAMCTLFFKKMCELSLNMKFYL